ncbi:hypothetical protein AB0C10_32030 [Microbispora amethystogenes]|uniref:hypothetical protein n=1 Tax=Microbispora amethystogenes TaxID=1427754 RepID=UPI0033D8DFEE
MSRRSRWWWAAALAVSSAGLAYSLTLARHGFAWFSFGYCPVRDLYDSATDVWWPARAYFPLAWYSGLPGIVVAFAAHWAATRAGRPRAGRVLARVAAAPLLVLFGLAPLAFALDLARDTGCLDTWGGALGVRLMLLPDAVAAVAALCALAAVRMPRHRLRRALRPALLRRPRRSAPALAVLALLALLPVADLAVGEITSRPCEARSVDGRSGGAHAVPSYGAGERRFLCDARESGRFADISDRDLLAYGHAACDAYRPGDDDAYVFAAVCPPIAVDLRKKQAADEAAYRQQEAVNQRACDSATHRPRVRPLRVVRALMGTDYGVIESLETEAALDDDLLTRAEANGLVAALPGHLIVITHSDFDNCLTVELYRRRPPVEVSGWDHVVEVGYRSPTGRIELMDPIQGESDLPKLAFRGRGRYRIRVHYRVPAGEPGSTQDLLIMIFPGADERTIEYLPRRGSSR